jgi:alkyldihydroxyacetonephosphate synthase
MNGRRRKHWGWGWADEQPSPDEVRAAAAGLREHLGFGSVEVEAPAPVGTLRAPRLEVPGTLAAICSVDAHTRATHSYGASYRDVVRGFRGAFDAPTDVVARPGNEEELEAVLEWAVAEGAAVIPFGGGTSVVGGVEPSVPDSYPGVLTVDVSALDRVLEVDSVSLAARIQAGATLPAIEEQLRPHGLTLRFYPQSFEFVTLGGAIATRGGGHFATGPTHIDDFVESVRALTPAGWWESLRLPSSGAGPSPDRLMLGSEGALGVITEAWVRVLHRPAFRAAAAVHFPTFWEGAAAARAVVQSGLRPANCRLIDPDEARLTFAGDGSVAILLLAFESGVDVAGTLMGHAVKLCREGGGTPVEPRGEGGGASEVWRESFFRAPYLRDTFVAMGVMSETFETAITWERFETFVSSVLGATREAVGHPGHVSCRLTHVYADGCAPYFTVVAPVARGFELERWSEVKRVASEAILAGGGTITHHHAVGRDHLPWYRSQRPQAFNRAMTEAKRAVDPGSAMNPGVLFD